MNHLISSLRGVDFPYWKVKLDPYTPQNQYQIDQRFKCRKQKSALKLLVKTIR